LWTAAAVHADRSQVFREEPGGGSLESTSVTEQRCSLGAAAAVLTAVPVPAAGRRGEIDQQVEACWAGSILINIHFIMKQSNCL